MNIFLMFDMAMAAIHHGLWDRTWVCVNPFPQNMEQQNGINDLAHMFDIVEKYTYYYQVFFSPLEYFSVLYFYTPNGVYIDV